MDRAIFDRLVKDTVTNLYDFSALNSNLLLQSAMTPPPEFSGSKGEYLRRAFLEAIEQLRPPGKEFNLAAPEWRPYVILSKRYVEGMGLQELAAQLALSDRQLRRDHHRALEALTHHLWESYACPAAAPQSTLAPGEEEGRGDYAIQKEVLNLAEIIEGVRQIAQSRFAQAGLEIHLDFSAPTPPALADRVILRQILISLFNEALRVGSSGPVEVCTHLDQAHSVIALDHPFSGTGGLIENEEPGALEAVRYWSQQINANFKIRSYRRAGCAWKQYLLYLPRADHKLILVVDDQEAVVNLFRRYLSQNHWTVSGVNHAGQVMPSVRQLKPDLITLDVMMPKIDGWELLQMLKLDEHTRHIPVVVCSAWEEPELARSLGAAGFLKKPVTQRTLLEMLAHLNL